jgi:hypothetical protein
LINQYCHACIDPGLKQPRNERVFAEKFVKKCEQIRVAGQAIESEMLGKLTVKNLFGPIVVEMHIAPHWQQKRRMGKSQKRPEAEKKHPEEEQVAKTEGEASGGRVNFHRFWH